MEIRAPVISPPQYQVKKQVKVQPGKLALKRCSAGLKN
jgi:hypothetical protein